jgi:hypothetical protein
MWRMSCARLVVGSNRLPVVARVADSAAGLAPAGVRLATGPRTYHE